MIGCQITGYKRLCAPISGGVANLYVGDANDFDFTQAAKVKGKSQPYTAIAYKNYGSGATATASLTGDSITGITVTQPGTGYTLPPTVKITGDGTGAIATAIVVAGVVTAINVEEGGTGYTTAPTISLEVPTASAADGALFYEIQSVDNSIVFKATQSNTEGSSEWAYDLKTKTAEVSQLLTQFLELLDASAACCQLVFILVMNTGKVFVIGEKFVNGAPIPKFGLKQDGSTWDPGAELKSFNGSELNIKGVYSRPPYEFTGGMEALAPFLV